jgi:PAS domain S-box-containing protein
MVKTIELIGENSRKLTSKIYSSMKLQALSWLRTPDGMAVFWNRGAETVFGYSSTEVIGRLLNELIVPSDRLCCLWS